MNFLYKIKKLWVFSIISEIIVYPLQAKVLLISPKTDVDTLRLTLASSQLSDGDTILLDAGTYIETQALKVTKSVVIAAKPQITSKPLVNVQTAGFDLAAEKISLIVSGIEFSGRKKDPTNGNIDNFLYVSSGSSSCDTFNLILFTRCILRDFGRVFHFGMKEAFYCDSFVFHNNYVYNKTGTDFIFKFADKAYFRKFSCTNSTFYNCRGGIFDNPRNNRTGAPAWTPKTEILVDHNTFFACVSDHRSFIQTQKITQPDSITMIITNNIIDSLLTPTYCIDITNPDKYNTPFRNRIPDGAISKVNIIFKNNCVSRFDATHASAAQFNLAAFLTAENVTASSNLTIYPNFIDTTYLDNNPIDLSLPSGSSLLTASTTGGVIGDPDGFELTPIIHVESLIVKATGDATIITTNKGTLQMIATVSPSNATNIAVNWSVSDTLLATVSSTGLLTAKANGIVKVKATSKDNPLAFGEIDITISKQLDSIKLKGVNNVISITSNKGTLQLEIVAYPINANNEVTWSISDTSLATISSTGLLTAKKDGKVKVTATSKENTKIKGEIEITISGQVGINSEIFALVNVYPNPAEKFITINTPFKSEVIIYNVLGKQELSAIVEPNGVLDIQDLKPGMFIIKIISGNNQKTIRLIKK